MNNIIIENDNISFENEVISIDIKTKSLTIYIKGNVTINEIKCHNILEKLNIVLEENSTLHYNRFSNLELNNLDINVDIKDNSYFYGAWVFIAKDKHHINIDTHMNGRNINNILDVRILSKEKGNAYIAANADVIAHTAGNILKEDIRVLNTNNNEIEVLPNMMISSQEVQADHFNTISGIDENELFYLQSKGISKEKSEKLIEKGFIYSIFTDDFIQFIK